MQISPRTAGHPKKRYGACDAFHSCLETQMRLGRGRRPGGDCGRSRFLGVSWRLQFVGESLLASITNDAIRIYTAGLPFARQ
jgi:hypothetical protein